MNEQKIPELQLKDEILAPPGEPRIQKPEIQKIVVKLRMNRPTCEAMFQRAMFTDDDFDDEGFGVIDEIIRPCKPGELYTLVHSPTGQKFCVDHYEMDGVIL